VLGAALAVPAAAPAATVSVEKTCYAEGDEITVSGTGFTPNGGVRLALERADGTVLETSSDPVAGPDGSVSGDYGLKNETGWFTAQQTRFQMTLRLTDTANAATEATTSFTFSRWNVGVRTRGGKIHPRRRLTINAIGYTTSIGKSLYAHWTWRGRRVHTRRLGRLRGACGDLRATLRRGFPFRVRRRGVYQVAFNSSRTNPRAADTVIHDTARVR
jgi:hypothetical protein